MGISGLDFEPISHKWFPDYKEVGVIVPCHINDKDTLLPLCLEGLRNLNPQPDHVFIDVNDGSEGLKAVRSRLFDKAFSHGCDVVLQCSVDFYLRPNILKYVRKHEVVSFTGLFRHPYDVSMCFHRFLLPWRTWSGCYSLPRHVWFFHVRDRFDGSDYSVCRALERWRVKSFGYFVMRPYREDSTRKLVHSFSLPKKLLWQFTHLRAVA